MKQNLIWSKDFRAYIDKKLHHPSRFSLGNRLIYWVPGEDTYCSRLIGSEIGHWHCADFHYNLDAALEWLHKADTSSYKHYYQLYTNGVDMT